jgi:DNA-directed RNA polymerase specialized sigma24 family protein
MSAEGPGSITRWIQGLKAGRPDAVEAIWRRYFDRVLAVARHRLRHGPRQAMQDDEDVALSALHGLAAGAAQGRFDRLDDRSDLWRILAAITARRAARRRRWYGRRKRLDPGARHPASAGRAAGHGPDHDGILDLLVSKEPPPELAAILRKQLQHLLDSLTDPTLRQIAEWRLEGLTHAQIAAKLDRAVRTVERKIERIRQFW